MAWHSSGNTNEELVDNLVENNQISSTCVVDAFRSVDRIHFVPKGAEEYAYHDSPLKEGNVHISAPHIYCTVVEALDLEQNSNLSFLNIGSGTGYLSCIVGHILGASSLSYGVELHDDVLQHSKAAINAWKDAREDTSNDPPFDFFHGNGFHISSQEGESRVGYDRIYVGAQISIELEKIKKLLAPGGILVAPVNESLMKVIRMDVEKMSTHDSSLSPLTLSTEYVSNEITGVHFAPLQRRPKIDIVIPAKKWSPSLHSSYPQSFQDSVKEILLCSRTPYVQKRVPVNMSATLPRDIWVHIFSFANRNWFNKEIGELPILRRSLRYEQNAATEAKLELAQLQARNALLEREREICMNMMRRWRTQMQYSLQQRESYATRQPQSSSMEEDPLLLSAQSLLNETNAIISTYRIRPQGMDVDHMDDDDDDDDDEDDDDDDDDNDNDNERGMMDLDSQSGEHQVEESDEDNDDNDNRRYSFDMIDAEEREHDHERQHEEVVRHHLNPVTAIAHPIVERPQIRSVSITNEDL